MSQEEKRAVAMSKELAAPYVASELPNRFSDKIDLYADVANKLGITREEAKARVLAEAYGLIKKSPLEQVAEFHARFGLPGLEQEAPRELTDEEALFRINFMLEELKEYAECSGFLRLRDCLADICAFIRDKESFICSRTGKQDLHGMLDALIDLSYVNHGTALFHGFRKFDLAFTHVHKKGNMVKIRATSEEQSKRGTKLDVVKPLGWTAPVLTEFLS